MNTTSNLNRIFVALVCVLLPVVATLVLFFPVIRDVALVCYENDDYSHGLLLPFISVILGWMNRQALIERFGSGYSYQFASIKTDAKVGFSWLGLLLLLFGLFIFIFGEVAGRILFIQWCALFPVLIGVIFLTLGRHVGMYFVPLVLLLFMARPIPESLIPILFNPLQVYAAKVGGAVLEALDVPVYLTGNIIEIPGMRLLVEEACSGMRSVMALLTVALIVSYMFNAKVLGTVVLTIVSVIIAVALNVLRVALTGVLAHFVDPEMATGFFHEFTGMIVFIVGLFLLYGIAGLATTLSSASILGAFASKKRRN